MHALKHLPPVRVQHTGDPRDVAHAAGWNACRDAVIENSSQSVALTDAEILVPFKLFDKELPALVKYSSSYGGVWSSEWCAVIDHNGHVSMDRFTASVSEKEALDRGDSRHAKWRSNGSWSNYVAWAYKSEVIARISGKTGEA